MPFSLEIERLPLALLVLGAAALLVRRRPRLADAPRIVFVVALALAAGDLSVRDPDPPRLRVFVVDRTRSFAAAKSTVASALDAGARDLDPVRDEVAFIAFGARPVVALEPSRAGRIRDGARAVLAARVDDTSTDIGAALDLARDLARARPLATEAVLITDGRDTAGRAREAAALLGASGVVLHVVAPIVEPLPNARVARILAPSHVGEREPARVVVLVESSVSGTLTTALSSDDLEVVGDAQLRDACEAFVPLRRTFVVKARRAGVFKVKATVHLEGARDAFPEDDELEQTIVVGEASRALVVSGDETWSELLASFDVTRVAIQELARALRDPTRGVPDLVVLDEVPAAAAPVKSLREYLDAGGGVVVSGDEHAFGPGDYSGSDLEKLLPVRSGPPDERAKPLALELVIDASGSMADYLPDGQTRYEAARHAVVPTTKELRAGDQLEILIFNDVPMLDPVKWDGPSGGTDIAAALVMGLERLGSREGRRLLVLVTDGGDPNAMKRADEIAAKAAKLGPDFQCALVLIGKDREGDETLRALAGAIGKSASFFSVSQADDELRKLVKGDLVQGSLGNVRHGHFVTNDGLVIGDYAPVRPRERELARTEISLRDPERELPAALAVSSDRVLCVATSLAKGGAPLAREGRTRLLELVRQVVRRRDEVELRAERTPGFVHITARTTRTGLVLEDEDGGRAPMRAVAPFELEAVLPAGKARVFRAVEGGKPLGAVVVPPESSLELAPPPRDAELLSDIVAPSHGRVFPELGPLPRPGGKESARRSLARELALLALAFLVLEEALVVLFERLAARRAAARAFEGG